MSSFHALVTGAGSPLGLAVGRRLQAEGMHSTGMIRGPITEDIRNLFDELVVVDLASPTDIDTISGNFDAVIHVAALSEGNIHDVMNVTGIASSLLVQRAIELGIPRFVHVSSMSIYGEIAEACVTSTTPIRHSTPYGVAKWFAESALHSRQSTISGVSVRSPAIVGARSHRHFLAKLLRSMLEQSTEIRVSNPEFLSNNLIHEDTFATFLVDLAKQKEVPYSAFPVASRESMPLGEIVSLMVQTTRYQGSIRWVPSNSKPFSIDLESAIQHGFHPLSTEETVRQWLASIQH